MSERTISELATEAAARHARGEPPIVIPVRTDCEDRVREFLRHEGFPDGSYVLDLVPAPVEPPERFIVRFAAEQLAAMAAKERASCPLTTQVNARADELLAPYRRPNPEAAARYRAERQAKRAARSKGKT